MDGVGGSGPWGWSRRGRKEAEPVAGVGGLYWWGAWSWGTGDKGALIPQQGLCAHRQGLFGTTRRPHCRTHRSSGERDLGAQSSCLRGGVAESLTPHTCARSDCSAPPSSASAPSPGCSSASLPGTDGPPAISSPFRGAAPHSPSPLRAHPQPLALEEQHAGPRRVPLLDADGQHRVVQPGGASLHTAQRESLQLLLEGEKRGAQSPHPNG